MNKTILIGNLTNDMEIKTYNGSNGDFNIGHISIAENYGKDKVNYFNLKIINDKMIDNIGQYLLKGKQIFVEFRQEQKEYINKEGNKAKSTENLVLNIQLLGRKDDNQEVSHKPKMSFTPDEVFAKAAEEDFKF